MGKHSHTFVNTYKGFVGFGLDRKTNENTVKYCLQKFSDDSFMDILVERLSNSELEDIFNFITGILKKHLLEEEYHSLYMKETESD